MLQFVIRFIPVSLFLLSNSLLNVLGINYMGSGGSAAGKLHPSFYITLVAVGLTFLLARRAPVQTWIKRSFVFPLVAASIATLAAIVLGRPGSGDSSAALVTFLTPALIAYVLQFASERTRLFCTRFMAAFFITNSLIGLVELGTSWRLLPYYVSDTVITFDNRPTALLGHPLLNALMTGVVLLSLVTRQITDGLPLSAQLQMALHATALFAFGGRASLLLFVLITTVYVIRHSGLLVRVRVRQSARSMLLALLGIVFFGILSVAGVTEALFERFVSASDSTNTRFAAFELLNMLSLTEWLIGTDTSARAYYLMILETPYGIEISPIAMIYVYGLPIAFLLLVSVYQLLFRWASNSFAGARYVVMFTILSSLTSLSIGSKSLMISQMLIILFALRPGRTG